MRLKLTRPQLMLSCFPILITATMILNLFRGPIDPEAVTPQTLAHLIAAAGRDLVSQFNPDTYAQLTRMLDIWQRKYQTRHLTGKFRREVRRTQARMDWVRGLFQNQMRRGLAELLARYEEVRKQVTAEALRSLEQLRDEWLHQFAWYIWSTDAAFQERVRHVLAEVERLLRQNPGVNKVVQ